MNSQYVFKLNVRFKIVENFSLPKQNSAAK